MALASGGCGRRLAEGSHLQPPCRVTRNPTAVCAVAPQIVIQDGLATKWLFTSSKTGEVLKKRSVENKSFIVETFVKAALSDPANTDGLVGVLWAKSPSVAASPARVLAKDDFEEFMKSMAGSANDLCALQVRDGAHSPVPGPPRAPRPHAPQQHEHPHHQPRQPDQHKRHGHRCRILPLRYRVVSHCMLCNVFYWPTGVAWTGTSRTWCSGTHRQKRNAFLVHVTVCRLCCVPLSDSATYTPVAVRARCM